VTKSPRPSPSVFAYCKQSNTGGGNGLGTRLVVISVVAYFENFEEVGCHDVHQFPGVSGGGVEGE